MALLRWVLSLLRVRDIIGVAWQRLCCLTVHNNRPEALLSCVCLIECSLLASSDTRVYAAFQIFFVPPPEISVRHASTPRTAYTCSQDMHVHNVIKVIFTPCWVSAAISLLTACREADCEGPRVRAQPAAASSNAHDQDLDNHSTLII